MAMLELIVHGDVNQIVGNQSKHGITKRYQIDNGDDESYASDLIIEKNRGHEIIQSRDNVHPTHVCYRVVAQVD